MAFNSFGNIFKLTSFGESHGIAIGGIIEGCPAGLEIDFNFIQNELEKRKPGQSHITTQRKEADKVEFLSGVFEGKTTGLPIGFLIKNNNAKSDDYAHLKDAYRPGHADFTYQQKYGIRDYRGGGRSSARETACRVVAGAVAKLLLQNYHVTINAFVKQVGEIKLEKNYTELNLENTFNNIVRCPDDLIANKMIEHIETIKKQGDTVGGIIQCVVQNCPVGLGEPVFDKLHAVLGHAMLSINAVKGFEIGSGFDSASKKGTELNDVFSKDINNTVVTTTNNSGGIQGGISNGMPIYFNVAFKPVATIMQTQNTVNTSGNPINLDAKGRHDPCVLPRAVPIVEAMTALVIADFLLLNKVNKL